MSGAKLTHIDDEGAARMVSIEYTIQSMLEKLHDLHDPQ